MSIHIRQPTISSRDLWTVWHSTSSVAFNLSDRGQTRLVSPQNSQIPSSKQTFLFSSPLFSKISLVNHTKIDLWIPHCAWNLTRRFAINDTSGKPERIGNYSEDAFYPSNTTQLIFASWSAMNWCVWHVVCQSDRLTAQTMQNPGISDLHRKSNEGCRMSDAQSVKRPKMQWPPDPLF